MLFSIQIKKASDFSNSYNVPVYSVFLLKGNGQFSVDFVKYEVKDNTIIFLSPYQNFSWLGSNTQMKLLQFHGDFYCIEYHKKEVACNGLLFNNIYLQPNISITESKFKQLEALIDQMELENLSGKPFSDSVLKSYLQLFLAISSREKASQISYEQIQQPFEPQILEFQHLLEHHFSRERSPSFYAEKLALSSSAFNKKVKFQFGKTPSKLIQERVILESKKLLHLTQKSVKEIATELHFDDEFYFSRYFKKEVGLSPTHFREKVGISIVAK
ncbi:MAG TPA: AraC family transcriptional regulator [Salinimicrobium sp.]|nr:AraC family transcriptional regulator [Salinimicrobium sp.]